MGQDSRRRSEADRSERKAIRYRSSFAERYHLLSCSFAQGIWVLFFSHKKNILKILLIFILKIEMESETQKSCSRSGRNGTNQTF